MKKKNGTIRGQYTSVNGTSPNVENFKTYLTFLSKGLHQEVLFLEWQNDPTIFPEILKIHSVYVFQLWSESQPAELIKANGFI